MKRIKKTIVQKQNYEPYSFSTGEWVITIAGGIGVGTFVAWLCYHSVLAAPLVAVIAAGVVRWRKCVLLERKKEQLHYHFKEFISAFHTALRAGYSVENGIKSAKADLEKLYGKEDILVQELTEMVHQMEFQVPAEQLFLNLGRRSGIEDIRTFAEMLIIAKRTGGNLSGILQNTWRTLVEKIDTRQEIQTVIASKKYEQTVMSLMPACIILYLRFTFSGFIERLYGNLAGVLVMTICLTIYAGAFLLGRRMIRIEV